jgi:hypothetical protein
MGQLHAAEVMPFVQTAAVLFRASPAGNLDRVKASLPPPLALVA